ncbi:hypothetical protein ACFLVP_01315 [Chloroflexota bacterium]
MFARVTAFQLKIDEVDEAVNVYKEELIPARQEGEGVSGGYLLVDRKTGKAIAVTLWDRAEYNTASETSRYYAKPLDKFKSHFESRPVDLGLYEVCTQG